MARVPLVDPDRPDAPGRDTLPGLRARPEVLSPPGTD